MPAVAVKRSVGLVGKVRLRDSARQRQYELPAFGEPTPAQTADQIVDSGLIELVLQRVRGARIVIDTDIGRIELRRNEEVTQVAQPQGNLFGLLAGHRSPPLRR